MSWSGFFAALVLLCIFGILGAALNIVIKARQGLTSSVLIGYMLYYGIFEIVYLLCLAFNNSLNALKIVWGIVITVMLLASLLIIRKNIIVFALNTIGGLKRNWKIFTLMSIFSIGMLIVYICGVSYISEEGYAYSAIGDSLYNGRLFMRDVFTGAELDAPDMRYAFSGYYMHTAVLCSIFKVSPVIMQHNIMGIICILMSLDVVYLIGRAVFMVSLKHTGALIICYGLVNVYLLFYSGERYFLFTGAYDGMTQLPYIIVPAIILGLIYILKYNENRTGWVLIALCAIAGVSFSAAAVEVVPLIIVCGIVTVVISRREYRAAIGGLACLVPGIIYNVIYRIFV